MNAKKSFSMMVIMILMILMVSCTQQTKVGSEYSFAIYLVKDVSIREAIEVDIEDLKLVEKPIISDRDLLSYNWQTHELNVEKSLLEKLAASQDLIGRPFVVVAAGERIYLGAFYSYFMSASLDIPVILTVPIKALTIDLGYPSSQLNDQATDLREDQRIYQALQKVGKIKY